MSTSPDPRFEFALLPDTEDARLFIELSHFGLADLLPAALALELASEWNRSEDAPEPGYLVDFAVVAYCRAFFPSKVRKPLGHYLDVPAEFEAIDDVIRSYRNTTVAHSQSELVVTWPLVVIDHERGDARWVHGVTIGQYLPWPLVEEFRRLIDGVTESLDELIEQVRARLDAHLLGVDELPPVPEGIALPTGLHSEFNARTKRTAFPSSHTLYAWVNETGQG